MTDQNEAQAELSDDEYEAELARAQEEEAHDEAEESQETKEQEAEENPLDPLPAEEWKSRHDNLKGALAEERKFRQQQAAQNERMEQAYQKLLERMGTTEPKQEQLAIPDAADDPLAALRWVQDSLKQQQAQQAEQARMSQEQQQQAQQFQAFQSELTRMDQEFAKDHPDYFEAVDFYSQSRAEELTAFGYNPMQVQQTLAADIRQLASSAIQAGVNPAEVAYKQAQARGFQPKDQEGTKRVQQIQRGRKATSPLSSGGGKSGNVPTLADIAELDGEEFDKAVEALRKREGLV